MQFTALDRVARDRRRVHEFLNPETGKIEFYRFEPDTAVAVPRAFALLLARNPDFLVQDEGGRELRIVDTPAGATPALAADQTVAALTELTHEALAQRVTAAGGRAHKSTPRAEMIAFLVNEAAKPAADPDDDETSTVLVDDDAA